MRIRFCMGLCLLILLVSYGCGGSAEVERKEAERAMNEAKNLHAEDLAPADFEQAQKSWNHAQAVVKEGNIGSAKVIFTTAKINFNKSAAIAKSRAEALTRELDGMQLRISSNLDQVNRDLISKNLSSRQRDQARAIVSEVMKDNASISKLANQGDLLKAVAAAKDVQTKIYNAQLILAGRKPAK
jgi:hypothetical protein